uniref:Uncharacterized protein n=1 Tax=Anguilla anguilla TaxID=7936 RepID=A0A0E9R9U6_ANGAN
MYLICLYRICCISLCFSTVSFLSGGTQTLCALHFLLALLNKL